MLFKKETTKHNRKIPLDEAKKFFKLIDKVDMFTGKTCGFFQNISSNITIEETNLLLKKIRDAWYNDTKIIDSVLYNEKHSLTNEDKSIIRTWKYNITGNFVCLKYYKNHALFYSEDTNSFYEVKALTEDFEKVLLYKKLPCACETTLLPYKNIIVWDGLVGLFHVSFKPNLTKIFTNAYKNAKKNNEIIKQISYKD